MLAANEDFSGSASEFQPEEEDGKDEMDVNSASDNEVALTAVTVIQTTAQKKVKPGMLAREEINKVAGLECLPPATMTPEANKHRANLSSQ